MQLSFIPFTKAIFYEVSLMLILLILNCKSSHI